MIFIYFFPQSAGGVPGFPILRFSLFFSKKCPFLIRRGTFYYRKILPMILPIFRFSEDSSDIEICLVFLI